MRHKDGKRGTSKTSYGSIWIPTTSEKRWILQSTSEEKQSWHFKWGTLSDLSQTLSMAVSPPGDPCDPNKPAALTRQMEPGA